MIRIGVIADTHLAETWEAYAFLRDIADRHFGAVDLVLHAGDIVAPALLAAFAPCPVHGVRGNMDPASPGIPPRRIVSVAGMKIGLIHGWGPPAGLIDRVRGEFSDPPLDCLVFGHSHVPVCRRERGLLLFNPGSATDRRDMPQASVGLLEIEQGTISGRILYL